MMRLMRPFRSLPLPDPRFLFRTFSSRNYRLFFAGQSISLTGTWMSIAAMGWLVYRLTGDPLLLGLVGFCMHAPTFLLSPLGGAISDRHNRRTVMVVAQSLNMITMLALAALTLAGVVAVWHVLTACVLLGVTKGFDLPARQALVVDIVGKRENLANAIALNSSMFHGARLVGPMLAGGLIIPWFGELGEGVCFAIDGFSYIATIACLIALRVQPREAREQTKHIVTDIAEGFMYTFGFRPMRAVLMLVATVGLFGFPYSTLLPVFAEDILKGDARTYGLLLAAGGMGALAGAMYLASRTTVLGLGRVITVTTLLFSVTMMLFAMSTTLWVSTLLLVIAGAAGLITMVGTNTILQSLVDDGRRGRVMSFFGMTFMGALPLGALLYGQAASTIGAPYTVLLGALVCGIAGLAFGVRLPVLRQIARPVYIQRGIIPEPTYPREAENP